jgi:hypothetical protein
MPEHDFDDSWSDDELVPLEQIHAGPSRTQKPNSHTETAGDSGSSSQVKQLEAELKKAQADLAALQAAVARSLSGEVEGNVVEEKDEGRTEEKQVKGKGKGKEGRDDDTHYFDSYAENGKWVVLLLARPKVGARIVAGN